MLELGTISFACAAAGQDAAPEGAPGTATPADARVDALKHEASTHFRRGAELFQEGAFRAALIEFERANELVPDYRVLYNIAQAHRQLQDYLSAAQNYERYLAAGGAQIAAARRAEIEASLTALRERVARLAIRVDGAVGELFVDDQRVGDAPLHATVAVNVGRHRVWARAPSGVRVERVIDVPGGEMAEVALVLSSPRPASPASKPAAVPRPSRNERSILATSAAAGSLLATAVVTGAMASRRANRADDELRARPPLDQADPERVRWLEASSRRFARATDVLLGAGVVLGATSLMLWGRKTERIRASKRRAPTLTWIVGGGGLHVCSRF